MSNIKDLFKKHNSSGKVLSSKSINELTSSGNAESSEYIQGYIKEKDRFLPAIDFEKPETFVRYGSAEKYYENAIQAVYRTYPYDGSHREKTEWHNSASYFDNYVFNKLYPRTNGYYEQNQPVAASGFLYNDGTSNQIFGKKTSPLYITVKGGPNKAGVADNQDQSIAQTFSKAASKTSYTSTSANTYSTDKKRASNFAIDGTEGNTMEAWIKPENAGHAVLFDLWNDDGTNQTAIRSGSYGRFLVERRAYGGSLPGGANFQVTYMSGTAGAERVPVLNYLAVPQLTVGSWNHLAFSAKNEGNALRIKTYLNGDLVDSILTGSSIGEVTGALNANIGTYRHYPDNAIKATALAAGVSASGFVGYNQFSGSIDEFRFWKTARTSKDVGRNWFTQVYGGTNTDDANTNLGVYFKFNEGITSDAGYDATVLDYSGRISNGTIVNYSATNIHTGPRHTGSAMVESSASLSEFKDPIIYSFHPSVSALLTDKKEEGGVYDARNASAIHTTLPTWMAEDDKEVGASNLVKIIQIMASYLDTLQLQLEFLPRMKDAEYTKFSHLKAENYADAGNILSSGINSYPSYSSSYDGKPKPFIKHAIQSLGIDIPEIFADADALEQLNSRDEDREYKDKLYNVKNQIYQNIYNNLSFILKSKGTEKSFRNLVRCFGVDDELVRLNLYGNNVDIELKNNFRSTAVKKTYVDFMDVDRQAATVYMMTSSVNNNTNALSYIPSITSLHSGGYGMTFQTEVYFPDKGEEGDTFYQPFEQLSSSLYGVHTAIEAAAGSSAQANTTWANPDISEFKVYAVRPESKSPHAYFQLTSSALGINLTSSVFDFVYDNEKWNFAVRIKPTKYPWTNALTGTNSASLASGIAANKDLSYEVSFYGAHADLDIIVDEFDITATVSASLGDNFMSGSKRVYVGAHRTNFSGGLLQESDVRISTTRAWLDYLTNDEIKAHAKDAENKGVLHPYKNAFVFQKGEQAGYYIPRSDLLIFEWDFTNVTSSDGGRSGVSTTYDARFVVEDISSGSTTQKYADWITDSRYNQLRNIVRNQFTGRGDYFEPNNEQVVDHIYIHSAKQDAPEVINSSDMIEILNQDDLEFTRESRPIDYFYAVEKSMYQTISDEMLRMFATITDFNNLIGEPVNRYRGQYKDMDKLKSLFFESIGNSPDLDKYVDFYKWIDAAITKFLEQLFPASANYSDELRTVVESHVLERSAYRNKFPTLEGKQEDPEVPALGINELTYNWKFGHAPADISTDTAQQNNCLWFNQRAERTIPALASGVTSVDNDKQTILDVATTDNTGSYLKRYEGSTYALRKLSRPYKEGVSFTRQIKGGVNFDHNKKTDLWKPFLKKGSKNAVYVSGSELYVDDKHIDDRHCTDNDELRNKNKVKSIAHSYDFAAGGFSDVRKINTILPFNLYTTGSTNDVYLKTWEAGGSGDPKDQKVVVVNHHHDGYGTLAEEPMQGTFTERWEGGNAHRHIRINDGRDITTNSLHHRPEAWKIVLPPTVHSQMQFRGHADSSVPAAGIDAPYYRDFVAKRPVVIKNILQTTASVDIRLDGALFHGPIGNYSAQHNIVQTSGRRTNNKFFVEQEGAGFGKIFSGLEASPQVAFYNREYKFNSPERKATDAVIVERFSAPGSFESMSRWYLDPSAEEMSAYNAMPFRNLTVRGDRFKALGTDAFRVLFKLDARTQYTGKVMNVTDLNGVTKQYLFKTSGTTGGLDLGRVVIAMDPVGVANDHAEEFVAAINSANGNNAGVPDSVLSILNLGGGTLLFENAALVTTNLTSSKMSIDQIAATIVGISGSTWSTSSLGLRSLLSRHTIFGGYDYEAQSDGAFHKTYRNRLRRIEQNNPNVPVTTGSSFDNGFVTHMIPRSDFQYSWITSSILTIDASNAFGFGYFPYSGEASSSAGGFASAVNFVSSSDFGSLGSTGVTYGYGITLAQSIAGGYRFLPVDFAGLNTVVVADSTQFSGNTIQNNLLDNGKVAFTGIGQTVMLNAGLLNRGGVTGYSTFRQIRNMYHPIAQHLKDTNTYSISVRNTKTPVSNDGIPYGNNQVVFPKLNIKIVGGEATYESQKGTPQLRVGSEVTIENYTEPPLSSKYMPLRHKVNVITAENKIAPLTIDHSYANNYDYFANPELMNKMNYAGVIEQPGRQVYDNLLEYTVKGHNGESAIPPEANPIKGFRHLVYKETIYPKEAHTYLAKSRGRTNYNEDITATTYTANLGDQRTFWRDALASRQRTSGVARNSLGQRIIDISGYSENSASPGAGLPYALSVFPLDVGDRVENRAFNVYKSPSGGNHGELTIEEFQQSMTSHLNRGAGGFTALYPTASIVYEYHNFISSSFVGEGANVNSFSEFIPNWDTARLSGKKPFFDSYEEYAADIRLFGQDHTVLPEFRISEHMDYYLDKGSFFGATSKNNKFLTLEGGHLSQSATSETSDFDDNFYDTYSHTDFLKHFDVIHQQHDGFAKQTKLTVKCHGIKKLLPYNGFYPINRTIQLGALMSQSFAPFLGGSSLYSTDPNAERVSSFMQPFFSPGILYNTIKSGLAVDWMGFTGSVSPALGANASTGQFIAQESGSFRLPFESLVDPQNYVPARARGDVDSNARLYYLDTRFHSSSHRVSGAYGVWSGQNTNNYSLAMNNFLAEVPNFFLEEGKLSSLESSTAASFLSGVTYYMDLDVYKTDDMIMYEGPNSLAGGGTAGGGAASLQARGVHYGPLMAYEDVTQIRNGRYDPAPAPWTPPYFYGKSTVRFEFKPHEFTDLLEGESIDVGEADSSFSLNEVVSFLAVSGTTFLNNYELDTSNKLITGLTNTANLSPLNNTDAGAFATKHMMQANASMNLFNVVQKPVFTYDPLSGKKLQTSTSKDRWIISPKFECPALNFSGNLGTTFTAENLHTRGMWRGYGELPSANSGIFYNVRDSFPSQAPAIDSGNPVLGIPTSPTATPDVGSLKDKLFANVQPQRVGNITGEKEISEAVVAIPFTVKGGKKIFYPFVPSKDLIVAKTMGRKVVNNLLGNGDPLNPEVFTPGQSLVEQIERMQKYVFPPSLDFINNENLTPFQMYIFEFNHTLDKEDLADIWQGVMPKISTQAEKQVSSVTHFLTNNEILLGKDITKEVRWMVFKVKQKAENSYKKLIAKTIGADRFTEEDFEQSVYSYNWPYDFFSLVELVKIDTGVQIGGEVPITPADITTEPVDQNQKKSPADGGPPLQIGGEYTPADNNPIQTGGEASEPDIEQLANAIGGDPII
jgi:hypothetical protein